MGVDRIPVSGFEVQPLGFRVFEWSSKFLNTFALRGNSTKEPRACVSVVRCVCIYIYAHIYIYIYTRMYLHIYIYIYVDAKCMHICIHDCMFRCVCICVYIYIYI